MAMLLLVAAATMFATSCTKDGELKINEENIVGEWGWPNSHEMKNKKINIQADHTGSGLMAKFEWSLDGRDFVATSIYGGYRLEMTIKSIKGDKMEVEGEYQLIDNEGNVLRVENSATGTLIKTVTTQSPKLTEELVLGKWRCDNSSASWDLVVNSDHTYTRRGSEGTDWSLSGSTFNGTEHMVGVQNPTDMPFCFTVSSMTSSAQSIVMNITYSEPYMSPGEGKLTKTL